MTEVAGLVLRLSVLLQQADGACLVALGDDGRPTSGVYTDDDSPAIHEAQYREGKGPCLDAWRDNAVIRIFRIDDCADKYPGFVAACKQHGVHSTLSLPMVAGEVAIGAMNLYARVAHGFGDDDESIASDLAAAGATVLANVSAYWTAFELGQHLNEAMTSRAVIEQAKGMLMAARPGLTADGAFDVLRRASQRENVKLRVIAARIVEGRMVTGGEKGDGG